MMETIKTIKMWKDISEMDTYATEHHIDYLPALYSENRLILYENQGNTLFKSNDLSFMASILTE